MPKGLGCRVACSCSARIAQRQRAQRAGNACASVCDERDASGVCGSMPPWELGGWHLPALRSPYVLLGKPAALAGIQRAGLSTPDSACACGVRGAACLLVYKLWHRWRLSGVLGVV